MLKFPSRVQWRQFFKVLTKKEKFAFLIFFTLALISLLFLTGNFYLKNTEIKPALGGSFTEGVLGHPRFINPIYAEASDVDRDLVQLIFSGLMKYNSQGEIVLDLAKEYEIKNDGKIYEFYLKENVFWQDGKKLTADDVIFTIETIQNPEYKSPLWANWLGVKAEKLNELGVRFELKDPYYGFLENTTVKIMPKHIWQEISPQSSPLVIYNLKPIGSGPYRLMDLKQDPSGYIKSLSLKANPNYFGKPPNIETINFLFFDEEKELIAAAKRGEIQGLALNNSQNLKDLTGNFKIYELFLPRYFAVFFNPDKSPLLAEKQIRQALNYGTNKSEIIEKAKISGGEIVNSPILPEIYGFQPPSVYYEFNPEEAKEILEKSGFIDQGKGVRIKTIKKEPAFQFKSDLRTDSKGSEVTELQKCLAKDPAIYPEGQITGYFSGKTREAVIRFQEKYAKDILEPWGFKKGTGLVSETTRKKLNEMCFTPPVETLPLKFSLTTVNQPVLVEVASLLKKQWANLGAEVQINIMEMETFQFQKEIIKPRNYEALLFGEVLGSILDPFPFWHSSQKKDPGLNLAAYQNKECDKLLEETRKSFDEKERKEKLENFQDLLIEDAPAVFLYNPNYLYLASKEIKGIETGMIVDPSKRFSTIEEWYIKTHRVWK